MKQTGMVRKLDDLGRLTLPKELRTIYGIRESEPVEIFTTDEGIVLKPFNRPNKELVKQLNNELNAAVGADKAEKIMELIEKAWGL